MTAIANVLLCPTDINECESGPCINGGVCIDDVNGYACACAPGYGGDQCETGAQSRIHVHPTSVGEDNEYKNMSRDQTDCIIIPIS